MSPTTIEAPRRATEIEAELRGVELELGIAREIEEAASQRVDNARADHAVARLAKSVLLGHQRQLASAQGRVADLEWRARGLQRLAVDTREAETAERDRAKAERAQALRIAGQELGTRIGHALAEIEQALLELAAEADAHDLAVGAVVTAPATTEVRARAWANATTGVAQLRTWYPNVVATTVIKIEEET